MSEADDYYILDEDDDTGSDYSNRDTASSHTASGHNTHVTTPSIDGYDLLPKSPTYMQMFPDQPSEDDQIPQSLYGPGRSANDAMFSSALASGDMNLIAQVQAQREDTAYDEGFRDGREDALSSREDKQTASSSITSKLEKLSKYLLTALASKILGQEVEDTVKAFGTAILTLLRRTVSDEFTRLDYEKMSQRSGIIVNTHAIRQAQSDLRRERRPPSRSTLQWLLGVRPAPLRRRSSFSAPERCPASGVEAKRVSYSDVQLAGRPEKPLSSSDSGSGTGSGGSDSGGGWLPSVFNRVPWH